MQLIKAVDKYTKLVKQEFLALCASAVIPDFALEVTRVFKYLKEAAKKMEPGLSHWFTVARPEAMAHTETQGIPPNIRKHFLLGG